jgi:hypothetical protein
MKIFLKAFFIICVGIAASHAGGFMMLHIGSSDGNGGIVSTCDGTIDLSTGCAQPMLGGI